MNFDQAFEKLRGHEGGYVWDRRDPGGETNFGISARQYPGEDIKGMTLERAKTIYLRDYWGPAGCDTVPESIKFDLFDMAVNSGVGTAVKTLQKAVGAVPDGVLGPLTLQAINSLPSVRLIARFNAERLDFLTYLPNWVAHGKGWARRIATNLRGA